MPKFQTVIVLDVVANSYEEAMKEMRDFAYFGHKAYVHENPLDVEPLIIDFNTNVPFKHNNDGQRVLYLHNESESMK